MVYDPYMGTIQKESGIFSAIFSYFAQNMNIMRVIFGTARAWRGPHDAQHAGDDGPTLSTRIKNDTPAPV